MRSGVTQEVAFQRWMIAVPQPIIVAAAAAVVRSYICCQIKGVLTSRRQPP
jgi:hypothetical protein